jgi:predicted nucleotidyltransferase
MTTPAQVVRRRRAQRRELITMARAYADALPAAAGVRAVVVFGAVARGDFNDRSDVDVLVVADRLPARAPDRLAALGPTPPRVEVVAWTPAEWRSERARGNPITAEAAAAGVWLRGDPDDL